MELTSDYKERIKLFSTKATLQFTGYLLPNVASFVLTTVFPNDIIAVYAWTAVLLALVSLVALLVLACGITERPAARSGAGNGVPFVVAIYRAWRNQPYRAYLLIKFPLSLVGLVPVNMLPYFLRYVMKMEAWGPDYYLLQVRVHSRRHRHHAPSAGLHPAAWLAAPGPALPGSPQHLSSPRPSMPHPTSPHLAPATRAWLPQIAGLVFSFVMAPLIYKAANRFGKRTVILWTTILAGLVQVLFFFIPSAAWPIGLVYVFSLFSVVVFVTTFIVMDAMLADVIDYEELTSGKRAEGVYTVAETNMQQFVEIIGGVLPLLVMNGFGFQNNGGCSCGCGVACEASYLRWSCPADVGYACTDAPGVSPPLYGDASRTAPCVEQSTNAIEWTIRIFLFAFSGVLLLMGAYGAYIYPITAEKHAAIQRAIEEVAASGTATDPITGAPVALRDTSEAALTREHFSKAELRSGRPLVRVSLRLALWAGALLALFVLMLSTSGDAQEYLVTIGAICCSGLFVLIPWEAVRVKVALGMPPSPVPNKVVPDESVTA